MLDRFIRWCLPPEPKEPTMVRVHFNLGREIVFNAPDGCPGSIGLELPAVPRSGEFVELRFNHGEQHYHVTGYARNVSWVLDAVSFTKVEVYVELGSA